MWNLSCPPEVRRWFDRREPEPHLEAVFNTIIPNGESHTIPRSVRLWLVEFAYRHLQAKRTLAGETAMEQMRVWVAFAIRYLHPMLTDAPCLVSHDATANLIKTHYRIVQRLVEDDLPDVMRVLGEGLSDVGLMPDDDAASYPAYLDNIADREARTFARAADRGRDQVIAALTTYLQQLDHNPTVESVRTYLTNGAS